MSLVPLLFSNWWEDLDRPHRILDQHFGINLHPEDILHPSIVGSLPNHLERSVLTNPLLYLAHRGNDIPRRTGAGSSTVEADKDQFRVNLDVQQFKPEEIDVKVVDRFVTVEANHEEKRDEHGWISRKFVRKYLIPEQCNIDEVTSSLSSDGVLTIAAPRKDVPKLENQRSIKIQQTGKPAIVDKPAVKQHTVQEKAPAVEDKQQAGQEKAPNNKNESKSCKK